MTQKFNNEFSQQYRASRDRLRHAREYLVLVQAGLGDTATDQQRSDFEWFYQQLQDPVVQAQLSQTLGRWVTIAKKTGP